MKTRPRIDSRKSSELRWPTLLLLVVLLTAPGARGDFAFLTIHNFSGADYGFLPESGLVKGRDGNFYGTTTDGGTHSAGTVYQLTPAGAITYIHSFDTSSEGANPRSALTLGDDGNFYGTTCVGGTNDGGTVFQITPAGDLRVLHSFAFWEGVFPFGTLTKGVDGNFYCTAVNGGLLYHGTIYEVAPDGGFNVLYSFAGGGDGAEPNDGLALGADGNLYGTTATGAIPGPTPFGGSGTVFQFNPAGALNTLYEFTGGADGACPQAGLVLGSDGNFYGTTAFGGPSVVPNANSGYGTVFRFSYDGTLTTLYSFPGGTNGAANPQTRLSVGADGNLYGETINSTLFWPLFAPSSSPSTIFKTTPDGTTTILHAFQGGSDGAVGAGPLTLGNDGNFYAVAQAGGNNQAGDLFRITPAGATTTLYSFLSSGGEGRYPLGGLAAGPDGNLYGTTTYGGANDKGSLFRMTPGGATTTLYSFTNDNNGFQPGAELRLGKDGNFYGTTTYGGPHDGGAVFKMTTSGMLTNLHTFGGGPDGHSPEAGLVPDTSGNLYGTTVEGGLYDAGTVFVITPAGTEITLHSFESAPDGAYPFGTLAWGTNGSLYGTTTQGGGSGLGTVFEVSTNGDFTMLYSFGGTNDSAHPRSGLVLGTNGNFIGTTKGGASGSVFQITPDGGLTTIYSFGGAGGDGSNPSSPLTLAPDGNYYGTTIDGGAYGWGTVFQLTPYGAETVLHSFSASGADDGQSPWCGLTLVTNKTAGFPSGDFALYGAASAGGGGGQGTIFELVSYTPSPPVFTKIASAGKTLNLVWSSFPGGIYQLQAASGLDPGNWTNVGLPVTATSLSVNFTDTISLPRCFYRVQLLGP